MTGITVLKSNVPHGPFTRAEIAQKLAAGEITPESLAFVEGLTQWTPLRDVLAKVDAAPSPHAPIGTGFGLEPQAAAPVATGAGYSYAATMAPPGHLVYGGFWLRFVAYIIDTVLLTAVSMVFGFIVGLIAGIFIGLAGHDKADTILPLVQVMVMIPTFIVVWLYFACMESSRLQATLGKMALGLRVTDRQGNRIGFGRATGRFFGKIISALPIYVGFMMAGWTERKQALHDLIADTLVVRKPAA